MIGIKQVLLLASSFLLVCSVFGSDDAAISQRELKGGSSSSIDMSMPAGILKSGSNSAKAGKGGKGGKGDDDAVHETTSPETMPSMETMPPKGSKSSKMSKKEGKKSKNSKKASKKGGIEPPAGAPSAPFAPTPTTPSPTSANSIPIRATPYALFYTIEDSRIPSTAEYAELAELTRVYLEVFMVDEFSQTSLTNLDDFLTFMIRNSFTFGEPVQCDYRSTGLFNPSSIFLPTVRELNDLITTAFSDDNLDGYLERVQSLPSANIFSTASAISKGLPDVPIPRKSSPEAAGSSGYVKAGVASAAAGILVLAAGLVLFRRRKDEGLEEFDEKYGKNLKGDATIADETCNMSLDGSSVGRKNAPYELDDYLDEDEDELEDEPLDDSDDEQEADAPRKTLKTPPQAAVST